MIFIDRMSGKHRLISLEPRILLDAAGAISGMDAHVDSVELSAEFEKSQLSSSEYARADDVAPPTQGGNAKGDNFQSGVIKAEDNWQLSLPAQTSLQTIDGLSLIVVDTSIENYQSLLTSIDPNAEILYLDPAKDGLLQLADYVRDRSDISAIHILSHGAEGSLKLGSSVLDEQSLSSYQAELALIGQSLTNDGDILLYGCDVGEDISGVEFVSRLASYTGADIAASTDLTGSDALSGDWDLEYHSGDVQAKSLSLTDFNGLLGFSVDDHNNDSIADPIRMITWNVIGLDSNRPETSGPDTFMVGFRVSADAGGLSGYTAKIVEDSGVDVFGTGFVIGDSTIPSDLDDGVDNVQFTGRGTAVGNLYTGINIDPNQYQDIYFNVEVLRDSASHDQIQPFHFEFFKDDDNDGIWDPGEDGLKLDKFSWLPDAAAANTPLYLYVEKLISQARNEVTTQTTGDDSDAAIRIDGIYDEATNSYPGSPVTIFVGQTLNIRVEGATATQGYSQLTLSTSFDTDVFTIQQTLQAYDKPITNTAFQQDLGTGTEGDDVDFVDINDSLNDDPNTSIYASPAGWNPATHGLMITSAPPKAGGGPIVTDYTVEVVGTGSGALETIILDYSGSSFHYNADFGTGLEGIQSVSFNAVLGAVVGTVGVDTDGDSLSNAGITGVTITLKQDADDDGSYETTLGSTTTDVTGKYIFSNLLPGKYQVTEAATATYTDLTDYANGVADGGNDNIVTVELSGNPSVATAGYLGSFTGVDDSTLLGYVTADFVETGSGEADLSLTMTVDNSSPIASDGIAFTLIVTNDGPDATTGVAVTTELDSNVTYTTDITSIDGRTSDGGSYNSGTGIWTIGALASGETAVLVINATAPADMSTASNNHAEITASALFDPDSSTGTDRLADDLGDGAPDDDEASVTLASRLSADKDVELSLRVTDALGNEVDLSQSLASGTTLVFTFVAVNLSTANNGDTGTPATIIVDFPETDFDLTTAVSSSGATDVFYWTAASDWNNAAETNPSYIRWIADNGNANKLAKGGTSATLVLTATTKTAIGSGDSIPLSAWWSNYGSYNDVDSSDSGATLDPTISDVGIDDTPAGGSPDGIQPDDDEVSIFIAPQSPDLVLTKTVSKSDPDVGDEVTFTLILQNTGAGDATGVTLVDEFPGNLTYSAGTASSSGVFNDNSTAGNTSDDTITWSGITVLAGRSRTFTFQATVDDSGALTNVAEVTAADQPDVDDTYGNGSGEDYATVSVDAQEVDLELTKVASAATWNAAAGYYTTVFTLTAINNSSDDTATGVVVRDSLPAGLIYLADNGAGDYNSATGRWDVGTLGPAASDTLTITVRINSTATISNYAEIIDVDQPIVTGTLNNDSTTEPDDASVSVNVDLIDLSLTSTLDNNTPSIGDTITYTVTLNNDSGFDTASNIQVTETIPAGLSGVTVTPSSGTYVGGVWSVSSLAGGASLTLTISGTVDDLSQLKNLAEVTAAVENDLDSAPNNRSAQPTEDDTTEIWPSSLAYITGKVLDDADGYAVDEFDPGDSGISGVTIVLRAAGADATFDTADDVLVTTTTNNDGVFEFFAAAGTYRIDETDANGMSSIASLTSINPISGAATLDQTDPGFNQKNITVTAGNDYYENNFLDLTPWTISGSVFNDADTDSDFSVGDTGLGSVTLTLLRDTNNDGNYDETTATTVSANDGSYAFGELNAGKYRVVETDKANTTDVKDSDDATGNANSDQIDITLLRGDANSTGNDFLDVGVEADLKIAISPSSATPAVGDTVTWTVTVTNESSVNDATGVSVEDIVPAGFSNVASISNGGSETGGTISWSALTVNAGSSITLTFAADVQAAGSYTHVTQITASDLVDSDSEPNNDDGDQSEDDEAAASVTPGGGGGGGSNSAPTAIDNIDSIAEDGAATTAGNVVNDDNGGIDSDPESDP
ncbi:MAG: putative repeat protein (TIGR01451 family), partial [Pseudohongiellaceae bacterium]